MINTVRRRAAVAVVVMLCAACGGSSPTSPSGTSQPPAAVPLVPTGPASFPPVSGQARIFVFDRELSYAVQDYTRNSRFVLYASGGFVLQYAGRGEYLGRYTEANGVVTFDWDGWSLAGPWGATGSLTDDSLTIRYNVIMQLTDFEDAVYVRAR